MVEMKVFGLYDASEVRVEDPGLKKVINLNAKLMLKSHGRIKWDPTRAKVNVVENEEDITELENKQLNEQKIIEEDNSTSNDNTPNENTSNENTPNEDTPNEEISNSEEKYRKLENISNSMNVKNS